MLQVVLEGPAVNTYVGGPAAATALMMMYLKTGDASIAAKFKVGSESLLAVLLTAPSQIVVNYTAGLSSQAGDSSSHRFAVDATIL